MPDKQQQENNKLESKECAPAAAWLEIDDDFFTLFSKKENRIKNKTAFSVFQRV